MPANDESYAYLMEKLGERISRKLNSLHLDQKYLADISSQSKTTISNIIRGKTSTSMKTVFEVMEALEMNPLEEISICTQRFSKQAPTDDELLRLIQNNPDKTIAYDPQDNVFKGYTGPYYIYFHSTNPHEDKCLTGQLDLKDGGTFCKAALHLNTDYNAGDGDSKDYQGYAFISTLQHAVYVILINMAIGEMCFITFRHDPILSPNRRLECTIGMVLTISSGIDSRIPTAHRIFLSRVELDEQSKKYVLAQLLMNKSLIRITKKQYDLMCAEEKMDTGFLDVVQKHCSAPVYYEIEEKSLKQYLRKHPECFKDLCKLRQYSAAPKNNKVNDSICSSIYRKILQDLIEQQKQTSPQK